MRESLILPNPVATYKRVSHGENAKSLRRRRDLEFAIIAKSLRIVRPPYFSAKAVFDESEEILFEVSARPQSTFSPGISIV
jgi:hypothetical protein